jgi:hypothetical protein
MADGIFSPRNANHKSHNIARLRFLHFLCTLCAEYAFPSYEIVPRPALRSENLRDNGLIAGSLEALSVPGDLSKIGGRDFLHCTNLMELTAQGFTRTVSITLATKMQSQVPENISDSEIEKRVLQESI